MSYAFLSLRQLSRRAALLLASVLAISPLHAQTDVVEPYVDASPASATFTSASVPVTLYFRDDTSLDTLTRWVKLNGTDVTGQFTFTAPAPTSGPGAIWMQSVATGTLTLPLVGENVLTAGIEDQAGNPAWPISVTYTYAPGQQGVVVTPDGGSLQKAATATETQVFYVKNTWSLPQTFTLQAACREAWTGTPLAGCSVPASVAVNGGDSAAVTVTYPTGSAGRLMMVRLSARNGAAVEDAGWVDVTAAGSGSSQLAPLVTKVDLNQGLTTERSDCVTAAVAPSAAYECGDLRMAHAMPSHRTHGRTWTPVLLYSSQHAHPMPTVYADVTVPATAAKPDTVRMSVTVAGGTVYQARFPEPTSRPASRGGSRCSGTG